MHLSKLTILKALPLLAVVVWLTQSATVQSAATSATTATFTADPSGTFPRSMSFSQGGRALRIDLTRLPKDARVFQAELVLRRLTGDVSRRPIKPTRVYPKGTPNSPLRFVAPRNVSLDALNAVRAALSKGRPLELVVETTCNGVARLEVSYVGQSKLRSKIPMVTQLQARHRAGQTMLTFREPKLAEFPDFNTGAAVAAFQRSLRREHPGLQFRIWRSTEKITPATIHRARLVGECGVLTAWNFAHHQSQTPSKPPVRFRVVDGDEPVDWGTGIYAHNPMKAGQAYYAVTVAINGEEDLSALNRDNTTTEPVVEAVGDGLPILQWVETPREWYFRQAPPGGTINRLIYTRWESWPHASRPSVPIDYLVVIPGSAPATGNRQRRRGPGIVRVDPAPVGLHLHEWGGSLNHGYGWWHNAHRGAVLIASNQVPYDWWTGHHESYETCKTWGDGKVHPFTIDRLYSVLNWATRQWQDAPESVRPIWPKLDMSRLFVAGTSMGGSGSVMHAIRFGDQVAWGLGWVGVHVPAESNGFKKSYAKSYGPLASQIRLAGTDESAWTYYDDDWWLRNHIGTDTAFIIASNGKNDGAIGWEQAVKFARALQETRRPHKFNWGMQGHGTRTLIGANFNLDLRVDQTLPAFTNCSLDDDIGTASPRKLTESQKNQPPRQRRLMDVYDGDSKGAYNAHLTWITDDIVDKPGRWEMTVVLQRSAPEGSCYVDITPRRLQQFATPSGHEFRYAVAHVGSGKLVDTTAVADKHNLLTLEQVPLRKGMNRVVIIPKK